MKILLLVPKRYSLYNSFMEMFADDLGAEVYDIDYWKIVKKWEEKINSQTFRIPDKWRLKWEAYYHKKINDYYIEAYKRIKPDIIFVYNHELLFPETVAYFKQKGTKVAFFLGDNPFYTPASRYFLAILFYGDAIFVPDTFWIHQLEKIGLKNLYFFQTDIPINQYYPVDLDLTTFHSLKSEVLYVGASYPSSWGYKKARFLSHFTDFDLQIHGDRHWKKWFSFFPALEPHFKERTEYYSLEKMNNMFNATKIIPVDGNPGILHGPHLRIWEALGSGALPLMEWQNDLMEIFGSGVDLPAVKSYDDIKEMVTYYLNHEAKRKETVAQMQKIIAEKYSNQKNLDLILAALQIKASVTTN